MRRVSNYFKRKKILITGHTGFKGSWLSLCLHDMGAKILGISNGIPTKPSHFGSSILKNKIKSKNFDISNKKKLEKTVYKFKPDYIFHLAAQSLVKKSYSSPLETWKTNFKCMSVCLHVFHPSLRIIYCLKMYVSVYAITSRG